MKELFLFFSKLIIFLFKPANIAFLSSLKKIVEPHIANSTSQNKGLINFILFIKLNQEIQVLLFKKVCVLLLGALKIRYLLEAKVLYSFNPDDDIFMPNLDESLAICNDTYHFTVQEINQMRQSAWLTRFGRRKPIPSDVFTIL